jgi:hypothetical protein
VGYLKTVTQVEKGFRDLSFYEFLHHLCDNLFSCISRFFDHGLAYPMVKSEEIIVIYIFLIGRRIADSVQCSNFTPRLASTAIHHIS